MAYTRLEPAEGYVVIPEKVGGKRLYTLARVIPGEPKRYEAVKVFYEHFLAARYSHTLAYQQSREGAQTS